MAKISFTKLGLKPNNEVVNIYFNDQTIEVKQYLPVEEKLELISKVLELSHDSNNFSNPVKIDLYTMLEIIDRYTNITFTDKQKENPTKIYDLLISNELGAAVINALPKTEYETLINAINRTIKSVYKYQNSILGILEAISADYSNLELDANKIQQTLQNSTNFDLVKEIVTKLG